MRKNKLVLAAVIAVFFAIHAGADIIDTLISPQPMALSSMPMHEFNVKIGFDFEGRFGADGYTGSAGTEKLSAANNVSFAVEYIKYFNQYVGAGTGVSAQIPRGLDELPGQFGFAPFYVSVKVRSWPQEPGLYGYVLGQIGYNLFYADSGFEKNFVPEKGGFYYGIGLGFVYDVFLFEGMFSVNSGKAKDSANNRINIDYDKFTVSVGYKF
ncbi:MAG: hypothetical protein FWG57_07480 [Endomicrobia bacterium]|nr:hypothetical protein [Bacillota bacterium]MCL1972810.1 hypothetical protein [Endomicrobiia bacterium]